MDEADIDLIERARLWALVSPSQLRKAELLRLLELAGVGPGFAAYDAIKSNRDDPVVMTSLKQLLDMIDGVPPDRDLGVKTGRKR